MSVYTFPSAQFPAFPAIEMTTPESWRPVDQPAVLMSLAATAGPGRFATNVTATVSRHLPEHDLADSVAAVGTQVATFAESRTEPPFETTIGGRRFLGCNAAFRYPEAGTLLQVHLFTALATGQNVDVVHLVGTCAAEDAEAEYRSLHDVLSTCRVTHDSDAEEPR